MIDFLEYGFLPPNGELDAQRFGDRLGDLNVGGCYRLRPDCARPGSGPSGGTPLPLRRQNQPVITRTHSASHAWLKSIPPAAPVSALSTSRPTTSCATKKSSLLSTTVRGQGIRRPC